MPRRRSRLRAAILLTGTVLSAVPVAAALRGHLPGATGADPERLLLAGCAAALAGCWLWLAGLCGAVCVEVLRAPELPAGAAHRLARCPRPVRLLLVAALGVAVTAGPAAAEHRPGAQRLLPALPDRAVTALGPATAPATAPAAAPAAVPATVPATVRVRPGDSLWSVTERLLRPGAPDRVVDRGWRRVAAVNRDRLGADPDLIFPGTVLRVPDLTHLGEETR